MSTEVSLSDFVTWVRAHVTGDEKGEAQIFLDRLFRGFGHEGLREAGATLEARVRKRDGGTHFADLMWKPRVLIEMKRRGTDLGKHYSQAFDYWVQAVPGRPRYVVLCNFDEFWVYDFETQIDVPVEILPIEDLPTKYGALAFMLPDPQRPIFGNDHQAVTRGAAADLASCFNHLVARGVARDLAQKFVLQMLVALFGEDIGLLERYTVVNLLKECSKPSDSYDLIGGLFVEMNTQGRATGGRFKGVPYFNGGLFAEPARIELQAQEVDRLLNAANTDWSKVRPEIFGTIFEQSLGQTERHAFGAHFTSPVDILKIIRPTIVEPWNALIDAASSRRQVGRLLERLRKYTVLDPACGSGNFLYLAYREIKRIEARLFERALELSSRGDQSEFQFTSAQQFYGLDINPFAIELAKVTMMIARKLAIDEFHTTENALPLDNLDQNFRCGDALITIDGREPEWPKADVIIGNPPFLGAKKLKPERGDSYVRQIRRLYREVPGMADYCVYWFRKAHKSLAMPTADDQVKGRAGLVGTQNIRNNASRKGALDLIVAEGTIVDAVENQPWSGEANVHVAIVNWVKTQDPAIVGTKRRLWRAITARDPQFPLLRHPGVPSAKDYELVPRGVEHIGPSLSDEADVSGALVLECNKEPQVAFQGVVPGYKGFAVTLDTRRIAIEEEPELANVVRPYLIGRDLLTGTGRPSRGIVDFGAMEMLEAMQHGWAWQRVTDSVLPDVRATAEKAKGKDMEAARLAHLERWWQFWNVRKGLRDAIAGKSRFLVCSRVAKRPIFCFVSATVVPDTALQCFALDDDYSFGILQSSCHWRWFVAKCSKLKADFRYTSSSVFDTFPFPQAIDEAGVLEIADAGRAVRDARRELLRVVRGGLRGVYRTLERPGANPLKEAHFRLDMAVKRAYEVDADTDILGRLLALNSTVASRMEKGLPVFAPGLPPVVDDPGRFVTEDGVRS